MIDRCTRFRKSSASYVDCEICEGWENFQNFAKWYYENEYQCNEPLCIDKDILTHGNKIYSPDTCILVPQRINLLFIKEYARRGDLPIGVIKHGNGYSVHCSLDNHTKNYIGFYYDPILAFAAYKEAKEKYIKEVADSYKNLIPQKIYEAVINYRIEITD